MVETVIDLGERTVTAPDSPALRRRGARRLGVVVALAGLLALGASAPPAAPARLVWSLPAVSQFDMSAEVLVVHDADTRVLAAYRVADGTRLWHREDIVNPSFFVVGDRLGLALNAAEPILTHTWLDLATGRAGASFADNIVAVAPDGWFITSVEDESGSRLARVSPDTGERQPLFSLPAGVRWTTDPAARRLAWWGTDGVLRTRDLATGAENRRDLGVRPDPNAGVGYAPGAWLVTRQTDAEVQLMSFGDVDLAPRWSRTLPGGQPKVAGDSDYAHAWGCGPVVCLVSSARGTEVLDAADGHVVRAVGEHLMSADPSPWQLVNRGVDGDRPLATIMNMATGEVPHPSWRPRGRVISAASAYLLGLDLGGTTLLSAFDETTGELRRVAAVPVDSYCRLAAPFLVCHDSTGTGAVRVWRTRYGEAGGA
ncbi:hypothetical protein [Luedemannella helvata]|uniref:WD40 repeat domain-containing protein n=1 Tax=Luedemannella helvata TaxID=349315 RepID=A0ABN2L1S1_9ACTN